MPTSPVSYGSSEERQLALILRQTEQILCELRSRPRDATREAELKDDPGAWRNEVGEISGDGKQLLEELAQLRGEIARLRELEQRYADENQALASRAAGSAYEAAGLHRMINELQHSLSWKITAPLRFLTKPLFAALSRKPAPAAAAPGPAGGSTTAAPGPGTATALSPFDAILPKLRGSRPIALIPCAIPFSAVLNQRPIACARYLADQGMTVIYIAWQWSRDEAVPQAGEEVYPNIYHLPLYGFLDNVELIAAAAQGRSSYICTLPSPALVDAVRPLRAGGYHIHYDIMDDWEGFHEGGEAPWFSAAVEQELVLASDTVTAVSDRLAEKFAHLRSDIEVVRNGYQPSALAAEQFLAARSPLSQPKIIGYFGHLSDAWFDWEAVFYAAKHLPSVEIELIGWAVSDRTRLRISEHPNIRFVGLVPQKDLHHHARRWWGGIIPFKPTVLSAAVDPLKVYEYLHFGLPTVVTGITGIAKYPLVEYAADHQQFAAALASIPGRPSEAKLEEVAAFLKSCVWEARLARLHAMITQPSGMQLLYAR